MESNTPKLSSPRMQRRLLWLSGLILAAGVAAVLVVFLRNTGTSVQAPFRNEPVQTVPAKAKPARLPPEARRVAGRFILTAVQRKHLDEAWKLVGPAIKQGQTYKQWLTGNIAVIPFLSKIHAAAIKADESRKDYILLEVALVPPKNSTALSRYFFLELITVGKGKAKHWVVNGWVPRGRPAIPANPVN